MVGGDGGGGVMGRWAGERECGDDAEREREEEE